MIKQNFRVIPVLLLKRNGFYKTTNFRSPIYLGDPINIINIFNLKDVDEIVIYDVEASYKRTINFDLLRELSNSCFVPLCYGGGISNIHDAEKLIKMGIEKVSVCSNLFKNRLIEDLVYSLGSSSVVATVNIEYSPRKSSFQVVSNDLIPITQNIQDYLKKLLDKGIGELIVNNVSREGTRLGLDEDLIRKFSWLNEIPVVWTGGIKNTKEVIEIANIGYENVSAIGVGSSFVYYGKFDAVLVQYLSENEKKLLRKIGREDDL
jgi:cyclase